MVEEINLTSNTKVFIYPKKVGHNLFYWTDGGGTEIPWKKYSIKETDFRVKTGSITTPIYLDLTESLYTIKIITTLHENFIGTLLNDEFTEHSDGTYTYQLQDMSRQYQSKFDLNLSGDVTVHRVIKYLLTRGGIPLKGTITDEMKKTYKPILSGLQDQGKYDQSLWGNYLNINTMSYKPKMLIRNTSVIEAIRDLTIGYMRYVDVYFDEGQGVLQIEPFSVRDWMNTGLVLSAGTVSSRKFKFDTTNAITGAIIQSTEKTKIGTVYDDVTLTGLDLSVFFGSLTAEASNPNQSSATSSGSSTTNAVKNTKKTTSSTKKTTSMKNQFNNKSKKILVSIDKGSDAASFKSKMISLLKKDGWSVTDLGVGPGTHSTSYNKLSKNYAVNLTIYNGADPATIAEPVTGWLKGRHEKYGVQLVQMWDTSDWTNPKGMKPYRYGNFNGYYCKKAWDDNYSTGNVDIKDLGAWFKKYYPKVIHCCGPTPEYAYKQFKAGGYFKYVNK